MCCCRLFSFDLWSVMLLVCTRLDAIFLPLVVKLHLLFVCQISNLKTAVHICTIIDSVHYHMVICYL